MNETMDRQKRIGMYLIIAGILVPLVFLPLVSGYSKDKGFVTNLISVGIVLRNSKTSPVTERNTSLLASIIPQRIPYRFILALGILLIFAGYMKMEVSKNTVKPDNSSEKHQV